MCVCVCVCVCVNIKYEENKIFTERSLYMKF